MLTAGRKALRRVVPMPLRRVVAVLRRGLRDRLDGTHARLARTIAPPWDQPSAVSIAQPIKRSPLWEGKLANLQRGAAMLDGVKIGPGEVFSFWHWLGRPSTARGFAVGRAIRDDVATGDPGGGLCQLSGIAYELGLRGGLTVVERHAHSRDLYEREEDRFTPLGLDATVVWPWKDLRLENWLGVAVVLRFAVEGMVLKASLQADGEIAEQGLELKRADFTDHRVVTVRRERRIVSCDRYAL
jgi:vancomycin resistance protein VanW